MSLLRFVARSLFASYFIAEGVKVVGELLESGRPLEALLVMPEKKPHWERAIASAGDEIPVYRTGRREYKKLSQDKEPEGLLAVVKKEAPMQLADFLSQTAGAILILDSINNPANLGALARSTNQIHHFAKRRLNGHVRRRARARIAMRHRGFLGRLANAHADHCA